MPTDAELYIESFLPADFFTRLADGDFTRTVYPPFADREAWEKISRKQVLKSFIADIFAQTENLFAPEILPFSIFREFAENGNRTHFEALVFRRRRELSALVCAMCLSGSKDKYLPVIANYVAATLEEFTWTLPAHCEWDGLKLTDSQKVCLFTAEACATMSLVYATIGSELDEYAPGISECIRTAVLERGVYPSLARCEEFFWFCHHNPRPSNWTIWCCANLILTTLLAENDTRKLADTIRQFLWTASRWAIHYPVDGYCDEGPGYFGVAGGMLANIVAFLSTAMPGSMDKFLQDEKNRGMFNYFHRVHITDYPVAYADLRPAPSCCGHTTATIAKLLNTPETRTFAAKTVPEKIYSNGLNEFMRVLCYTSDSYDLSAEPEKVTFYPGRLGIFRSSKFSASLKGGHNDEHHNHNDLGHSVIYYGKTPLLIDFGTERYAKINFSPLRYTLWYTRSSGHNAPVIGEFEQLHDAKYTATLSLLQNENDHGILQSDLSNAYPAEAGVKKFLRTLDFTPEAVSINDALELAKTETITVNLITPAPVTTVDPHTVKIADVTLELKNIECVEVMPQPAETDIWGPVSRIVLKTTAANYTLNFLAPQK